MYERQRVSVVFPAYNEEPFIRKAVEDFFLPGVVDEVVVVDNNSRDRTAEEAAGTAARVVHETAQGLRYALRRGLREATGDLVILAEPDGTFVGRDVLKLLAYSEDFDMVCGTRTTRELIWDQANMGWFLRAGNWTVAKLLQMLHDGPSLTDCGCTLRLIRRDALVKIAGDLTVGGSHFLPEMVILALKRGLRVIEIPVNYRGRVGESKITGTTKGALATGFRMIALVLKYLGDVMSQRRLLALVIVIAAVLPYVPTWNDYFIQDDFGVVGLLSRKPAGYFPRWFVSSWMDDIWGFIPDEIRPFVAPTYQIAAIWGAGSPVANHVINMGLHAGNALLVFRVAEVAAALPAGPALFAALVFALLPMQTESVAWVTGRVDSLPAFFYLASFLLFARWRNGARASAYAWSVAACFACLFSKQNALTLLPALVMYDVMTHGFRTFAGGREPASVFTARGAPPPRARAAGAGAEGRPSLWPYLPYAALTIGYLALRYELFGQVARESMLTAERFHFFLLDLSAHLRRMVFGEPGLKLSDIRAALTVGGVAMLLGVVGLAAGDRSRANMQLRAATFAAGWIGLCAAPTLVAGYASPRHMYLASAGWAIALGAALDVLWHARPLPAMRRLGIVLAAAVLVPYVVQLRREVRGWSIRAAVSQKAVADIEREALAAPPGSLIITDAPRRSWDFALPHALRPPFTREDIPARVSVISTSSIHCCPAVQWERYTRDAMAAWAANPSRPPVIALHWNEDTGELSRVSEREDPFLRSIVGILQETGNQDALDNRLLEIMRKFVTNRGR